MTSLDDLVRAAAGSPDEAVPSAMLADYLLEHPGRVTEAVRLLVGREVNPDPLPSAYWAETGFLVEATHEEQFGLWRVWSADSGWYDTGVPGWGMPDRFYKLAWVQLNPGLVVTAGRSGGVDVTVALSWVRLAGRVVCFWETAGWSSDRRLVDEYLGRHFRGTWDGGTRRAVTDAANFHHCADWARNG